MWLYVFAVSVDIGTSLAVPTMLEDLPDVLLQELGHLLNMFGLESDLSGTGNLPDEELVEAPQTGTPCLDMACFFVGLFVCIPPCLKFWTLSMVCLVGPT